VKIYEKATTPFQGLIIARKHGNGVTATITVRATVAGVGVEKVIPLQSPAIQKLELISAPKKVHKAKLYFTRGMSAARMRQKLGVAA
jgi:large subunit ribosomal protein L19